MASLRELVKKERLAHVLAAADEREWAEMEHMDERRHSAQHHKRDFSRRPSIAPARPNGAIYAAVAAGASKRRVRVSLPPVRCLVEGE